jgi:hypothetical protein
MVGSLGDLLRPTLTCRVARPRAPDTGVIAVTARQEDTIHRCT